MSLMRTAILKASANPWMRRNAPRYGFLRRTVTRVRAELAGAERVKDGFDFGRRTVHHASERGCHGRNDNRYDRLRVRDHRAAPGPQVTMSGNHVGETMPPDWADATVYATVRGMAVARLLAPA